MSTTLRSVAFPLILGSLVFIPGIITSSSSAPIIIEAEVHAESSVATSTTKSLVVMTPSAGSATTPHASRTDTVPAKAPAVSGFSVSIPSASIEAPIIRVGLNSKGEMDVPDGKTNNVGWYKNGPRPGAIGSAVLDAHVYAAFKNLKNVKIGDSIYVQTEDGKTLRFVVEETQLKRLEDTSAERLFNRTDQARLNLITCAGTYIPSRGTYDHRLVVYAVLAS